MTAEERRQLIEAPISIQTFGGRGWSGASYAHIGLGLHTQVDPSTTTRIRTTSIHPSWRIRPMPTISRAKRAKARVKRSLSQTKRSLRQAAFEAQRNFSTVVMLLAQDRWRGPGADRDRATGCPNTGAGPIRD